MSQKRTIDLLSLNRYREALPNRLSGFKSADEPSSINFNRGLWLMNMLTSAPVETTKLPPVLA